MDAILNRINQYVWGIPTLILILAAGLYLSVQTGFVQITMFPKAVRLFLQNLRGSKDGGKKGSSYRALCTALSATVGTGNLAGVAGAIAIGGPGAIFWMWVCAFLGMAIKYAEALLSVRYRQRNEKGEWVGGPMYMIQNGMGMRWKWLAICYAFLGVVASFGVGNATQINTVIGSIQSTVTYFGGGVSSGMNILIGIVLAALVLYMLSGGSGRIGMIAQRLVPFASVLYLLLGVGVLLVNRSEVPGAFGKIFTGAFAPEAVTGGILGSMVQSMRVGASRGIFTNEAGMGTAGIAHAAAEVEHPAQQGMMGIVEVFLDTMVICTLTALVILTSDAVIPFGKDVGIALTISSFSLIYGKWICIPIMLALCCFAIATILGWGLYGVRCAQYIFGVRAWRPFVAMQVIVVIVGAVLKTQTVWVMSEIVNGLMAIPNLIALVCLSPDLISITRQYRKRTKYNK